MMMLPLLLPLVMAAAVPAVQLRSVYQSHMVLQQGATNRIVGTAAGTAVGTVVKITLDGASVGTTTTTTTASGDFDVSVPPQPVSAAPHKLEVSAGKLAPATLSDVLFGE